ncbi:MAG: hypothetical protein KGM99_19740, partial [Burkholderiales bacterium]|nr:hypothetical protein [Burkholderiales bacterium]
MSPTVAAQWYDVLDAGEHKFQQAEGDLADFIDHLTKTANPKFLKNLHIVQIGDFYDLWVGMGVSKEKFAEKQIPLFAEDKKGKKQTVELDNTLSKFFYLDNCYNIAEMDFRGSIANTTDGIKDFLLDRIKEIDQFSVKDLLRASERIGISERLLTHSDLIKKNKPLLQLSTLKQNLAVEAFRRIDRLSNDQKMKVTYIYGNHDNYLAAKEFEHVAGLLPRVAFLHEKSLYIEHGHRLEWHFTDSEGKYIADEAAAKDYINSVAGSSAGKYINKADTAKWGVGELINEKVDITNHDGSISGFKATFEAYNSGYIENYVNDDESSFVQSAYGSLKSVSAIPSRQGKMLKYRTYAKWADKVAGNHDQRIYRRELARFVLAKNAMSAKVPSIFVIGHTHMPQLVNAKIIVQNERKDRQYLERKRLEAEIDAMSKSATMMMMAY